MADKTKQAQNDEDDFLSRDEIFAADDIQYAIVSVPEWGKKNGKPVKVRVRGAMAHERDSYDDSLYGVEVGTDGKAVPKKDFANAKARLVVKCVVNKDGQRVFRDEDASNLGLKGTAAVTRIFKKIQELSGMDRKSQEALEGN